jgi:hypothetical protein
LNGPGPEQYGQGQGTEQDRQESRDNAGWHQQLALAPRQADRAVRSQNLSILPPIEADAKVSFVPPNKCKVPKKTKPS